MNIKRENKILKKEGNIHETTKLISSSLGAWCELGPCTMLQNTVFDDFSYAGSNCIFQNVRVGKFSNIAAYVRIGATDHPLERPTQHHFTYRSFMYGFGENDKEFFQKRASKITYLGHDTWIGHGSMIKPNVKIGNGAVIGQGSVVTKDIPPYAIAVGVPAKVIKFRFNDDIIKALERIKWWNWDYKKIKKYYKDFRQDINYFIKRHDIKGGIK